jgi:hypothetical protein
MANDNGGNAPGFDDDVIETRIPHSGFGDPDCCGCLCGAVTGDQAEIVCNECEVTVRTVPISELQSIVNEMEVSQPIATAECPLCGAGHYAPRFSELYAFKCDECGEWVEVIRGE